MFCFVPGKLTDAYPPNIWFLVDLIKIKRGLFVLITLSYTSFLKPSFDPLTKSLDFTGWLPNHS
jgi:hypothetical protein